MVATLSLWIIVFTPSEWGWCFTAIVKGWIRQTTFLGIRTIWTDQRHRHLIYTWDMFNLNQLTTIVFGIDQAYLLLFDWNLIFSLKRRIGQVFKIRNRNNGWLENASFVFRTSFYVQNWIFYFSISNLLTFYFCYFTLVNNFSSNGFMD